MILRLLLINIFILTVGLGFAFAQIVNIVDPNLRDAVEDTLGKPAGTPISQAEMENLTELSAPNREITDLTGLQAAVNLARLDLGDAYVASEGRFINSNSISDLSPVSGLTRLTRLDLEGNSIRDISPLSNLTNLVILELGNNAISDITALRGLTNLFFVGLWDNNISDISPLVANRGFGQGEEVSVSENPLSKASIEIHIPALESRGVEVHFSNLKPVLAEYLLALPAGLSLIHIPLKVTTVDGLTKPIITIGDLYDALGGSTVNFIVTYNPVVHAWYAYFGAADRAGLGDRALTAEMGIVVGMSVPVSVRLNGTPLLINEIPLYQGLNLFGLPLRDQRIHRVSDLYTLDGINGNAHAIILTDGGEFKLVGRAGDPGDIEVRKGQGFIVIVERAAQVNISGDGW